MPRAARPPAAHVKKLTPRSLFRFLLALAPAIPAATAQAQQPAPAGAWRTSRERAERP
jgi:hypothetical protein